MNIHVSPDEPIDLTNCDREPIHVPGRIQSFGALLAFTPDWLVVRASENVSEVLGLSFDDLAGREAQDIFPAKTIHDLRGRLAMMGHADAVERMFSVDLLGDGRIFDVALHLSGQAIVVEMEVADGKDSSDYTSYIRPMIERIRRGAQNGGVEALCRIAARQVKALIGFDRVMIYQFAPDGDGHVIAEAREPKQVPFLGLRYPASDIPKQARALYKRSLLRIISDVNDTGIPVQPVLDTRGQPLDLSLSATRAVSPIHLEYLRNMGVAASMSISIMVRGELWGLIACHHDSPRVISYELRSAAELFAQLFGFVLSESESDQAREDEMQARVLHDRIMAELADGRSIEENFEPFARAIRSVIDYSGIALVTDGRVQISGRTPTKDQIKPLARFLNTTAVSQIFSTDRLSRVHPPADDYTAVASGILALPVSRKPRDYIILFRDEFVRSVDWGGNPDKPVEVGPNGVRLTPRKSFDAWTQEVHGQSKPWTGPELRAAESLRITLLEVVLRMTDSSNRERARSQEQQELLIAELNHRVRNILNLIRGLISQSADGRTVSEFTDVIGGRIHALARAHDQITQENWNPAGVRELIGTEAEAYLNATEGRLAIVGPDAMLLPTAFTTVSLVIHEMMTNAMKYGALSDQSGQVRIQLEELPNGALDIHWSEEGGPPVAPPSRRGFGTTITERSIPFELKGEADVRFGTEGVRARFRIPAEFVSEFRSGPAAPAPAPVAREVGVEGEVMVVEDNLIIALDAEDMLSELGASRVWVCADVAQAEQALDGAPIRFALLDVNLGTQTSAPVARRLAAEGIPFVFATGYGDGARITQDMPNVPVMQKPYTLDSIRDALAKLA